MRFRSCFLLIFAWTVTVQAQTQSLAERNAVWGSRAVISLPDDEGGDCPPYPAPVAATGQAECWDEYGDLVDCAGTAQDGEYQRGASVDPRFTDNGDGTVTDNLTGLIWLQDANCFGDWTSWTNAQSDASTLADGSCGLTDSSVAGDWRLPSLKELQSLVDYGQYSPALPLGHPFSGVKSSVYWTSTSYVPDPHAAWEVNLSIGRVHTRHKAAPITDPAYIWPVRGPQ